MPEINSFRFGAIVIDGKKYNRDVLFFPDGVVHKRKRGFWRFGSHRISKDEAGELLVVSPDAVIIGTGVWSRAKPDNDAATALEEAEAEIIILPSREAVNKVNELTRQGKRVSALIHLTC